MDNPQSAFASSSAFAARRPRVLLAEDHPVNRQTIQIMLGDRIDLHLAVNGREALEAARTWDFDVILMDADMPVMNGIEATQALRALEGFQSRPPVHVVLLTCATATDPGHLAAACGADQHLARPLTEDGLIAAIARQAQGLVDDESLAQLKAAA